MDIRLWGVRGSIATPIPAELLRAKMTDLLREARGIDIHDDEAIEAYLDGSEHSWTHGGNTSCVEVAFDDQVVIFDAGTGIRALGAELAADGRLKDHDIHCAISHFHWDHICGFPFFAPIYTPDKPLTIWSGRSDSERLLRIQMNDAHFPVKWDRLPAQFHFEHLEEDQVKHIGSAQIRLMPMLHPDQAYGYRIDHGGRAVCYLTDTEISKQPGRLAARYAAFVEGADVVIVDAMYGFLDYHDHINFGHSTIFNWVDFFKTSQIGELVIFHHDPLASDDEIKRLRYDAERYQQLVAPEATWTISAAREGQRWQLSARSGVSESGI